MAEETVTEAGWIWLLFSVLLVPCGQGQVVLGAPHRCTAPATAKESWA